MKLTREELYERVWQKPIREVAVELGISDVGLAKACRRNGIPLPHQGHWLKKSGSIRDRFKPELPAAKQGQRLIFDFESGDLSVVREGELARTEAEQRLAHTPAPEVMDKTISRLLKEARKSIHLRKTDERGIVVCQGPQPWPCRTAPEQVDRGMAILGLLWTRLQSLGYTVMQSEKNAAMVSFKIDDGDYWYWIEEHASKHERDYTSKELAEKQQAEAERQYFFAPNRWVYTPTGKLNVKLGNGVNDYVERRWADGASATLEQRVDEIIAGTIAFAAAEKRQREVRAMEAAAEAARKLRIRQKLQQQEHEALKTKRLQEEAAAWAHARTIREYVEMVRDTPLDALPQFKSEIEKNEWIAWACRKIDKIDPLTNGAAGTEPALPPLPDIPWSYRYRPEDYE
jgi:hypothetical protein